MSTVRSALEVSSIFSSVEVAGAAIATRISTGMAVHSSSMRVLSWNWAAFGTAGLSMVHYGPEHDPEDEQADDAADIEDRRAGHRPVD